MLFERKNTTNGIFESTPVLRHLAEVYGEDRVYIAMANAMGGQEIEDREMIRENERNRQKEQERSRGVSQYGNGEIDSSDEDQDFFAYESEEEENGDYMDGEGADDDVMETEDGEEMTKLTPISEEELERYAGGDDSDT